MRTIDASRERAEPHPRPEWFSGPVHIQTLNDAADPLGLEIFAVFFDPGARTIPHTHATDQLLYFLDGEGVVGTSTERRVYRAGGMAVIPADEWHWHGATPTSSLCHLSIPPAGHRSGRPTSPWAIGTPI